MDIEPFTGKRKLAEHWDDLVSQAPMGTFLHTRKFLAYHGDRFEDASLMVRNRGDLAAVFPAAVDPSNPATVTSHPGATFGGVVHSGHLAGEAMVEALEAIVHYYLDKGFEFLRYAAVPATYHRRPSDDDLYALVRLGASHTRCELSCAIDLEARPPLTSERKRSLRRADAASVRIDTKSSPADLWPVLEENLARRYRARPVHSLEEIENLIERFPEEIVIVTARLDDRCEAGIVLFQNGPVAKAQYIATSEKGMSVNALDKVFQTAIELAMERGRRFFDLGTSNADEGQALNSGLYRFKRGFGGGGVAHEVYGLPLDPDTRGVR